MCIRDSNDISDLLLSFVDQELIFFTSDYEIAVIMLGETIESATRNSESVISFSGALRAVFIDDESVDLDVTDLVGGFSIKLSNTITTTSKRLLLKLAK